MEVTLVANKYSLNVVVFTVDPHDCQAYKLRKLVVADPNNHERFAFLLLYENHYQHIVSQPNFDSFCYDHTNDFGCSSVDFDSSVNQSFMSNAPDLDTARSLALVDMYCSVCKDDTKHSVTLGWSINPAQEVVIYDSLSDAASAAHSTFQEVTNDPITAVATVACEWKYPISFHLSLTVSLFYLMNSTHHHFVFCHFSEAETCSDYTSDQIYILEFKTTSLSNNEKKYSPLQFGKLTRFQNNAVEYSLCNQCYCFLLKDIQSKDFADNYPSFYMESSCW